MIQIISVLTMLRVPSCVEYVDSKSYFILDWRRLGRACLISLAKCRWMTVRNCFYSSFVQISEVFCTSQFAKYWGQKRATFILRPKDIKFKEGSTLFISFLNENIPVDNLRQTKGPYTLWPRPFSHLIMPKIRCLEKVILMKER